ncbi:MAG: helix-turn-helix transcriptional regulator [Coxiellaceae bacterium]|nr:helix-turn-helix transcriptional regulator [Coxiellaceae bacterium]
MRKDIDVSEQIANNLCHTLFETTPIDFFAFVRAYDNGTCQIISTSTKIYNNLFDNHYRITADIPDEILKKRFAYLIPEDGPYHKAMHDFKSIINMHHPIDIIERYPGYFDMYCFATHQESLDMNNYYLNHMAALNQAIDSIRMPIQKLIQYKPAITLPKAMRANFKGIDNAIHYTAREKQCISLILKGYTARKTAEALNLSPRTIEHYFEKIKQKNHCNSRVELIETLQRDQVVK